MKKMKGIIFITMLTVMAILSLLASVVLSNMEVLTIFKENELNKEQLFHVAEGGLLEVAQQKIGNSSKCIISAIPQQELMNLDSYYWRSAQACHGEFAGGKYLYVIERLGLRTDACIKVINSYFPVTYFRITSLSENILTDTHVMLQITVAKKNAGSGCEHRNKLLKQGIQSWRQLM